MIYKIIVDKQPSTNPTEDKKEYSIDIEELRFLGDVHDSLVITKEEDYVMRRLSLSEYNVLTVLEEPIKEPLSDINIELFEGDNYIYLMDMTGNRFYARYIIKNDFTDTYVTVNQMNSSITQTAEKIELNVSQILTGYSTTQEMNSSIQQSASSIISTVNQKLVNYDTTAEVNSKIDQKADSITNTVSATYATKNELSTAKTEIKQTTDSISSTVSKKVGDNEVISKINQTAESATIDANKIGLQANDVLNILAGNTINMTTKELVITSDALNINKYGKISQNGRYGTDSVPFEIYSTNYKAVNDLYSNRIQISDGSGMSVFLSLADTLKTSSAVPSAAVGISTSSGRAVISGAPDEIPTVRVSNNSNTESYLAYNQMKTITCTAQTYENTSLESLKKNITKFEKDALNLVKDAEIYEFNYKNEDDKFKKHIGFIIGEKYSTPNELISESGEAIDIYSFVAVCCKAIQEQQKTIENLETRLARLEEKYG